MQEAMEQRDCPVMGEAMMLQAVQRLQGSLHTACTDLRSGSPGEAHLSMEGVLAFLEVLAVWRLLGDQGALLASPVTLHAATKGQLSISLTWSYP